MIEPAALLAWSALALAVTLAPGPDTLLVASHAARGGVRRGIAAVLGVQAGMVWYAALFGLGLLSLLAAVPSLFLAVKTAGALYLAWLGVQMILQAVRGRPAAAARAAPTTSGAAAAFRQAFFTNALNPKVALFYVAALPQFASGPDAPAIGAMLIGIHAAFGAIWLAIIATAAGRARAITWNTTIVRWLEGAVGAFFLGVAGRLALAQR